MRHFQLAILIAALSVAAWWLMLPADNGAPQLSPLPVRVVSPAMTLQEERELFVSLLRSKDPAVLRGLPSVAQWRAREWSLESMQQAITRELQAVMHSSTASDARTFFYVDANRPMLAKLNARTVERLTLGNATLADLRANWSAPYSLAPSMPFSEFVERSQRGELVYFSNRASQTAASFADDLSPIDHLFLSTDLESLPADIAVARSTRTRLRSTCS